MENTYLIVGLGNPGAEYAKTRHNAGFRVVERLAGRWGATWAQEKDFVARLAKAEVGGSRVLLCQPQTYMNASGEAVGPIRRYHRLPLARVLVVVDDADLPLGEIRMRPKGSSGGHHGLESVEAHLGSDAYARLRIGIGRRADGGRQIRDYVLGRVSPAEAGVMEKVLDRAVSQIECWLAHGIQRAMSEFNGAVDRPGTEES
jgi:PTH1 family peptidyl-tRNA hydrolase